MGTDPEFIYTWDEARASADLEEGRVQIPLLLNAYQLANVLRAIRLAPNDGDWYGEVLSQISSELHQRHGLRLAEQAPEADSFWPMEFTGHPNTPYPEGFVTKWGRGSVEIKRGGKYNGHAGAFDDKRELEKFRRTKPNEENTIPICAGRPSRNIDPAYIKGTREKCRCGPNECCGQCAIVGGNGSERL